MTESKKRFLKERREQRLALFSDQKEDHYEEKKIGDEWFVKSYNGGTKFWQVAVYSEQSFRNYKSFQEDREPKRQKWNIEPQPVFQRPTLDSIKAMIDEREKLSTVSLPYQVDTENEKSMIKVWKTPKTISSILTAIGLKKKSVSTIAQATVAERGVTARVGNITAPNVMARE